MTYGGFSRSMNSTRSKELRLRRRILFVRLGALRTQVPKYVVIAVSMRAQSDDGGTLYNTKKGSAMSDKNGLRDGCFVEAGKRRGGCRFWEEMEVLGGCLTR
jgi:hypothetical protein